MATIYKGAILPLLTYGAPVWIDAMNYEHNRKKYIRVQRLIKIRMAKAMESKVLKCFSKQNNAHRLHTISKK